MSETAHVRELVPLQRIDGEIHARRERRARVPDRLRPVEEALARAEAVVAERTAILQELKLEGHRRDLAVREITEKIERLQQQLLQVRKNEEYQALMREIHSLKADQRVVEDALLEVWTRLEHEEGVRRQQQADGAELVRQREELRAQVEAEMAALEAQIRELEARRHEVRRGIDPELVAMYERILAAKRDGRALAPLQYFPGRRGERDAYTCGGCNVDVTLEDANAVLRAREPISCRMCARLLYYPEE